MTPVIYLVDDDADIRSALSRALAIHGYQTECFESAETFLQHELALYSCLVLDVRMSGLSGFQLQQLLQQREFCPPIIFLTGHADVPSTVAAMKLGASDLLTKPVRTHDLLLAIETALGKSRNLLKNQLRSQHAEHMLGSLTDREREVFDRVIRGKLNKQIAFEMGISERTVKAHRQKVMSKMDALTVQNLMSIASTLGLLKTEPTHED